MGAIEHRPKIDSTLRLPWFPVAIPSTQSIADQKKRDLDLFSAGQLFFSAVQSGNQAWQGEFYIILPSVGDVPITLW